MIIQKFFEEFSKIPKHDNPYNEKDSFNVMDYFYPSENKITYIIRQLLDPDGPHNCGTKFLCLFLDKFAPNFKLTGSIIAISTEHLTKENRRIDLLLKQDAWTIAIENKPWAPDQENQITDYLDHLKRYDNNYKLIYLSARGVRPSRKSISTERAQEEYEYGSLENYSYSDLRFWLDSCQKECRDDPFLQRFLINFSIYIRTRINGELLPMDINIEKINFIAQNIAIAQEVSTLLRRAKLHIIIENLNSTRQKSCWEIKDWNLPWFYRQSSTDSNLLICFQFLGENFTRLHFGVSFHYDCKDELIRRYPHWSGATGTLNEALGVEGQADSEWIWLAPLPPCDSPPSNWGNDPAVWAASALSLLTVKELADRLEAALPAALEKTKR
jgi:hypothetical protein